MSRPLRLAFPGAIYHVTSRGNARADVFLDDDDREQFLHLLSSCIERYNWICHAYCLMDNHYHLLIETPEANLQTGMRQLNGVYTQRFNRTHGRVGHVFQGRYKAILVDRDNYLLELCRYVVLNPVRARMIALANIGEYGWSSYAATMGLAACPAWLHTDWLLGHFAKRKSTARQKYAMFVAAGAGGESPWKQLKGQVLLGDETFVEFLRPYLGDVDKLTEVPKAQRLLTRPSLVDILTPKLISAKKPRDEAIYNAHQQYGYSQAEIARFSGLHYSTVSRLVSGFKT